MQYAAVKNEEYPEAALAYKELLARGMDIDILLNGKAVTVPIVFADDEEGVIEYILSDDNDDLFNDKGVLQRSVQVKVRGINQDVTVVDRGAVKFKLRATPPRSIESHQQYKSSTYSPLRTREEALTCLAESTAMSKLVHITQGGKPASIEALKAYDESTHICFLIFDCNKAGSEFPDSPRTFDIRARG